MSSIKPFFANELFVFEMIPAKFGRKKLYSIRYVYFRRSTGEGRFDGCVWAKFETYVL